jgi:hypothetical protein
MAFNPYPSAADLSRHVAAVTRDLEDLASLGTLHRIIAAAIRRASDIEPIHHPDRKWNVADLTEALEQQLAEVDATAAMIRSRPVVIEDEG